MKQTIIKFIRTKTYLIIISIFTLFISCKRVEVEIDCGEVETSINALEYSVGSFDSLVFYNFIVTNFEQAAIKINIEEYTIETKQSCFAFTSLPQIIDKLSITSSSSLMSGGDTYSNGEELNELFILHLKEKSYTIVEFLNLHMADPTIFHSDDQTFVLQLLNKPDSEINQSLHIQLTFDDAQIVELTIPSFTVDN